nr:TPA: late expression factor-4 [Oryctes rhinoceros nudivirus]
MHSISSFVNQFEWETTISIQATESDYLTAYNDNRNTVDIIFLLRDGLRISNRTVQKKTTQTSRRLLVYYRNQWVSLDRTTAIEENIQPSLPIVVEKCIHRIIVHHQDGIRISYNKEVGPYGEKYNIEYEVEYAPNLDYKHILRQERRLMKLFLKHGHAIRRTIMTRIDMFSCVMSKVQMWHCFNHAEPYIWAYKWNGIKAKMLITDKIEPDGSYITYIWSDASTISNHLCRGNNIEYLINICCAVELMEDRIIIIEAIGTMVDDKIYTTEPMANASFLKHLNGKFTDNVLVDDKPLLIQKFYPPPLPNRYKDDCDGFIIIQHDLIIKWKIPTIDVKCITPYTFKVGSQIIPLAFVGEPGKIYEITYKHEVLRQRIDRLAASSDQEYAVFLDSSKMLLGNSG